MRLHRRPVRPERGLPDRLPAGRNRHALLRGKARLDSAPHAALTAVRYFGASLAGNLVVLYLFGITIQSMVMHVPFTTVAIASMGFVIGDVIKAVVASLAATGLAKLL